MDRAWRQRPVFVTGATGLLGGWVTKALIDLDARVVCLIRDSVPDSFFRREDYDDRVVVVRGDLSDLVMLERALLEYEIDVVFHLAAQTQVGVARRAPYLTMESNIRGTYTLLEAARRTGSPSAIVVASSDKAYGEQPQLPYTEEMPLAGTHPYDASKAATEVVARSFARTYGLPIVMTRCGNLFGGGDLNWSRIVPGTTRSLLRDERPVIRSDGTPLRDYLYVEDAATAYMELASHARELAGECFNYSLERPLSVLEVVRLTAEAVGAWHEPDIRNDAVAEIPRQYLSAEKARRLLGWRPRVTMEEGLARTVEWYRKYLGLSD